MQEVYNFFRQSGRNASIKIESKVAWNIQTSVDSDGKFNYPLLDAENEIKGNRVVSLSVTQGAIVAKEK